MRTLLGSREALPLLLRLWIRALLRGDGGGTLGNGELSRPRAGGWLGAEKKA